MKKSFAVSTVYEEDSSDSLSTAAAQSSQNHEDNTSPSSFHRNSQLSDSESLSDESKKIRKKREVYNKISDEIRIQLLEAVQNGETLKAAAKRFHINYSSAKSILHTYRKEGRILKKSAQERNIKKNSELVAEKVKTPKSSKKSDKQRSQNVDTCQVLRSSSENINSESQQCPQQQSYTEDKDNFFMEADTQMHSNFAYLFNYPEQTYETEHKDQESLAFTNPEIQAETETKFFDPSVFLCFKESNAGGFEENGKAIERKLSFGDGWENPFDCSLKSFMDTQNLFRDALRKSSFCHDDNDSGYRKTSIDLF